jgi:UDP-2,3-diacylglucosamine hydrolase
VPPAPCYLLSDVHLGVASREVERTLLAFLRHLPGRASSLIINGDLFDFWFEWRTVIPRVGYRVLAALTDLAEGGLEVTWIAGNHDGWGGAMLREEVGVTYRGGALDGEVAGWRARVEHGDGLRAREDRGYRALRSVIRHPLSVRAFRLLHPDVGSRLASGSSHASRTYQPADDGEGLRRVAYAALAARPALELLVYGHSHVATLERSPTGGVYANAGSWLDGPTYLRIDERAIALCRFDGSAEGDRLHVIDRVAEEALRDA